ncbi:peptidase S55 [Romboutsia weinsteinii]|uniref:Peptidase S55 n=1 Tax=Romboutsia weinsteinii TaxID=2020949 RepID=A0A371J8U5_9FIRM|nr:SpoIVB peptidase S55 domain-containing protein [Romboutsia weinsteinii]RDY29200.1 peptidase S55 [Romboutsia weinsteinii]
MFSKNLCHKHQNFIKLKVLTLTSFLFLVYFFSNSIIYAQTEQKHTPDYLIPIGNVLQIDAELETIIVRNSVENSPFQVGDSVLKVKDSSINSYADFSKILYTLNEGEMVPVLINRGGQSLTLTCTKDVLEKINFNNLLSGFATLTYINPETSEFGAVGHPINIGTSKRIPIKNGSISTTTDLNIQKSCKGNVGCISAKRIETIGEFNKNTSFGIKGHISNFDTTNLQKYKVASLNEIKTGKAQVILQGTNGKCEKYDIEIIAIENQRTPESKTFKLKITDKDLLIRTGGIVQGMSGTPIVQGDKIIGAVSHAVENDPTLGYGVYIKWMLENN